MYEKLLTWLAKPSQPTKDNLIELAVNLNRCKICMNNMNDIANIATIAILLIIAAATLTTLTTPAKAAG